MPDGPDFTAFEKGVVAEHRSWRKFHALDRARDWVSPDAARTVPARVCDLAAEAPDLKALARPAVLLHPRHSDEPAADRSKVGGTFLWPDDEEWPVCVRHRVPFAPILQLRQDEIPELPFLSGTDLMQLLWCPRDHGWFDLKVFWRSKAGVARPRTEPPSLEYAYPGYVPRPCRLFPERVTEFPGWRDLAVEVRERLPVTLPGDLVARLKPLDWMYRGINYSQPDDVYKFVFHPNYMGCKIGGWPRWNRDPEWPDCPECGRRMGFLLQVDAGEEASVVTPIQEQPLKDAPDDKALTNALNAPGLILISEGTVYLFVCRQCDSWPVRHVGQA